MKSRFYQMYKVLIEEQKRQKDYLCYVQFKIDNIDFELSLTSLSV